MKKLSAFAGVLKVIIVCSTPECKFRSYIIYESLIVSTVNTPDADFYQGIEEQLLYNAFTCPYCNGIATDFSYEEQGIPFLWA
jgi:hypothetical protein